MPYQIKIAVGQQICDRLRYWSEILRGIASLVDALEVQPVLTRSQLNADRGRSEKQIQAV